MARSSLLGARPALFALACLTLAACADDPENDPASLSFPIVYGEDDRLDWYAVDDADPRKPVFDGTIVFLPWSRLTLTAEGDYEIDLYVDGTLAEKWSPLCADEPFGEQPTPGECSGFLVAPDLVVSAGHCISDSECPGMAFGFGFYMRDADTPVGTLGVDDVYGCESIVGRVNSGDDDWAVIRLERPVVGHTPLPLRRDGAVESDPKVAGLLLLGYPVGLPAKLAAGADVREAGNPYYFQADLDAYGGNSGSAVVSVDETGTPLYVEGILVRGNEDFTWDDGCWRSNVCSDANGCSDGTWEEVSRTERFAGLVPPPCGDDACELGESCRSCPADCGPCGGEGAELLFFDDFSAGLGLWIETGESDWNTEPLHETGGYPGDGSRAPAAHADNCDASCELSTSASFDLTAYRSATLEFLRFVDSSIDDGEHLSALVWDGAEWVELRSWSHNAGDDNLWHRETIDLGAYLDVTELRIAFTAVANRTNEHVQVDDVMLLAVPRNAPDCGDLVCEGDETCESCPGDCGTCTPTLQTLAEEDFEAGWTGGRGWLDARWTVDGDASLLGKTNHYARLRSGTGDLFRSVDVSGVTNLALTLRVRVKSFETTDHAYIRISLDDGATWEIVAHFGAADSDDTWHTHTIDLPKLDGAPTMLLRFDAEMSSSGDRWFLDDLVLTGIR